MTRSTTVDSRGFVQLLYGYRFFFDGIAALNRLVKQNVQKMVSKNRFPFFGNQKLTITVAWL